MPDWRYADSAVTAKSRCVLAKQRSRRSWQSIEVPAEMAQVARRFIDANKQSAQNRIHRSDRRIMQAWQSPATRFVVESTSASSTERRRRSGFGATPDTPDAMRKANLDVAGTLDDLLAQIDVIVDCAPKRIAAKNVDTYRRRRLKFILQGGEKHAATGHSFVAE